MKSRKLVTLAGHWKYPVYKCCKSISLQGRVLTCVMQSLFDCNFSHFHLRLDMVNLRIVQLNKSAQM